MQIRNKLTLQFTGLFALLLLVFSAAIYYLSQRQTQNEFNEKIEERANITAKIFLEADETTESLMKIIRQKYLQSLPEEIIRMYDEKNAPTFIEDSIGFTFPATVLEQVRKKEFLAYQQGERQVVGIFYRDNQGDFVIMASAIDRYGQKKLENLRLLLISCFIGSLFLVAIPGRILAVQALKPIAEVVKQAERITATNLHLRLNVGPGKSVDELAHLAITFNNMLERLEDSFEKQRIFVSNASHELRTPLTAMTGEIEVALMKARLPEEYQHILGSLLDDTRRLTRLANGLLELAKVSFDITKIKLRPLRFDELIWQARESLLKHIPESSVSVVFRQNTEETPDLTIMGNEQLLFIALTNVLENADKFSFHQKVTATIFTGEDAILLTVSDTGIGIPEEDMKHIFEPFYRSHTAMELAGFGVGLSLTKEIVRLHKGTITIQSEVGRGTVLTLSFPASDRF